MLTVRHCDWKLNVWDTSSKNYIGRDGPEICPKNYWTNQFWGGLPPPCLQLGPGRRERRLLRCGQAHCRRSPDRSPRWSPSNWHPRSHHGRTRPGERQQSRSTLHSLPMLPFVPALAHVNTPILFQKNQPLLGPYNLHYIVCVVCSLICRNGISSIWISVMNQSLPHLLWVMQ